MKKIISLTILLLSLSSFADVDCHITVAYVTDKGGFYSEEIEPLTLLNSESCKEYAQEIVDGNITGLRELGYLEPSGASFVTVENDIESDPVVLTPKLNVKTKEVNEDWRLFRRLVNKFID